MTGWRVDVVRLNIRGWGSHRLDIRVRATVRVASHKSELGSYSRVSPGGPQAWGQEEEADTRAIARATKNLLSPEQLLLICVERGSLSNPPSPR